MKIRFFGLTMIAVGVLVGTGCRVRHASIDYHEHRHHPPPGHVTHVYADHGHVCTHACHDHYWDGARIVVISDGHRHGPGCGHHWNGKRWVVGLKGTRTRAHPGGPKKVHVRPGYWR